MVRYINTITKVRTANHVKDPTSYLRPPRPFQSMLFQTLTSHPKYVTLDAILNSRKTIQLVKTVTKRDILVTSSTHHGHRYGKSSEGHPSSLRCCLYEHPSGNNWWPDKNRRLEESARVLTIYPGQAFTRWCKNKSGKHHLQETLWLQRDAYFTCFTT